MRLRNSICTAFIFAIILLPCLRADAQEKTTLPTIVKTEQNVGNLQNKSAAYEWLDVALEATAREHDRVSPRPTVGSRMLMIITTAMYDAWAAYDEKAVGTRLGDKLRRPKKERTEAEFECVKIQARLGQSTADAKLTCDVALDLPTFTATAEMAGISRVMGGYHIQADNVAGLDLGRKVAEYVFPKTQSYFDGTANIR